MSDDVPHNPFASSQSDPRRRGRLRQLGGSRDNAISKFVRAARAARGWTQEEFARVAGVGLRQVQLIERGHLATTATTLQRVLAVFGKVLVPGDPEDLP